MTNMLSRTERGQPQRFASYASYQDSGIEWLGRLPTHWETLSLARITISRCDGPFGSGLKSEHYSESGIRVVRLQNIGSAEFIDSDTAYLDEAYARRLGDHSVKGHDILIAGLGDDGHPVGRACVAPVEIEPAMVKADCFRFRLDRQRVLPRYAAYQLSATASAVAGFHATGATRSRVNLKASAKRKIALPPLDEQTSIAAFLDRETAKISALVAKKERVIELLQEKQTALVSRAVARGLNPSVPMKASGLEWLGRLPAHWDVKRLWHLAPSKRKIMYGIVLPGPNVDTGVPIVKGGDVAASRLRPEALSKTAFEIEARHARSRLKGGDLVYAIRGSIGDVAMVPEELNGANLTQDAARVAYTPATHGRWLLYTLQSRSVFRQLEAGALGATIRGINIRDLKRALIPVPPKCEQEQIASFLDTETALLDTLSAKVHHAVGHLNELRIALISAAVTGKIDVRKTTPQ